MKTTITRTSKVQRTPRFVQLCGKFDLPKEPATVSWDVDIKLPESWEIGVIAGASMSGKSTVTSELFPGELVQQGDWKWPDDKCIVDGFPEEMPINEIMGLLSSVGFSSPPDWKKPYKALSNGGKFRVDLARTLAERPKRAVIDEFGSLVHREARCVAAEAAAKAVRNRGGQLVAICVHDDAIPYFKPDWVIRINPGEPVKCEITRGLLRPPELALDIRAADRSAWRLFSSCHYLSHEIKNEARCFVGYINGQPAAFCAVIHWPTTRGLTYREHRLVTLPDYQGIGIGNVMSESIASLYLATGKNYFSTTGHPALIWSRFKNPNWRMIRKPSIVGRQKGFGDGINRKGSSTRMTASFQFIGAPDHQNARKLGVVKD